MKEYATLFNYSKHNIWQKLHGLSNEGNAALAITSKEFSTYRDAGKTIDPSLIPNLTIDGLTSTNGVSNEAAKNALPANLKEAVNDYDSGALGLRAARFDLREAKRDIYGGQPGGDAEGRKDLREARHDLRLARRHFKEMARDVGDGEGAEEIKEGLRDLRRVNKEIGKAIRSDKRYNQERSMKHIEEALKLLDGETKDHTNKGGKNLDHGFFEIKQGINKALADPTPDDQPKKRRKNH